MPFEFVGLGFYDAEKSGLSWCYTHFPWAKGGHTVLGFCVFISILYSGLHSMSPVLGLHDSISIAWALGVWVLRRATHWLEDPGLLFSSWGRLEGVYCPGSWHFMVEERVGIGTDDLFFRLRLILGCFDAGRGSLWDVRLNDMMIFGRSRLVWNRKKPGCWKMEEGW